MKAAAPKQDMQKAAKLLKAYDSDEDVGKVVDSDEEEEVNHTI